MKRLVLLLSAVVMCFALGACSKGSADYVLTINGSKITKGEYMVYLYEQKKSFEERGGVDIWEADFDGVSAEEVAKQNAINSITLVKAAVAQSDSLKVKLGAEDYAEVNAESQELYSDMGEAKAKLMDVTLEDIEKIIGESHIQQKVYDLVTNGFQVNDEEFEAYFDEHYNSEISRYNSLTVKLIYFAADTEESTVNYDKAVAVKERLNSGGDFDSLMEESSASPKKEAFLLEDGMYDESIEEELYHLPVGAVSDVLESRDGYYIFKIVNIEAPDMDSVKEGLRAEYIREKKMEIYQEQNEQWQADMKIEKNDDVYNSIGIQDC